MHIASQGESRRNRLAYWIMGNDTPMVFSSKQGLSEKMDCYTVMERRRRSSAV